MQGKDKTCLRPAAVIPRTPITDLSSSVPEEREKKEESISQLDTRSGETKNDMQEEERCIFQECVGMIGVIVPSTNTCVG